MREKAEKPVKRKLTHAERKQIEAVIRQAKGDGKPHTVQDSIPVSEYVPRRPMQAGGRDLLQDHCL